MDLILFDLDGTLLNRHSILSSYTTETLRLLKENNIAFTIATGRTMQSAKTVIGEHFPHVPHIYTNGVAVWDPVDDEITLSNPLDEKEINFIVECATDNKLASFIHTVMKGDTDHKHIVFHSPIYHQLEKDLINKYFSRSDTTVQPFESFTPDYKVTNISMTGAKDAIKQVYKHLKQFDTLIAYSGNALDGQDYSWIDIHHTSASKGNAAEKLKAQLGATNVICFGDNMNDLSMFQLANECYAPENAQEEIKNMADAIIGHHDEDGVARFLRERFNL